MKGTTDPEGCVQQFVQLRAVAYCHLIFLDPEGSLSATTVVLLVVTLFEKCPRLC